MCNVAGRLVSSSHQQGILRRQRWLQALCDVNALQIAVLLLMCRATPISNCQLFNETAGRLARAIKEDDM